MSAPFFARLEDRVVATGSLLCVGLDPRGMAPAQARDWCRSIIGMTAPAVAAFKPNSAFFEAMGPAGYEVLIEVVAAIPDEIPVLLDAKRGDIASSAAGYATAAFERVGAGAVTVSPYLGGDSIEPFLQNPGSGVFVLCRTSNPRAAAVQEMALASGEPLYLAIAREMAAWPPDRVGLVVGATEPEAVARVRAVAPQHWILAPGVGAQGGRLKDAVAAGLRSDGSGLLLPVSRAIGDAPDPAAAVAELNAAIDAARREPAGDRRAGGLAAELFDAGCIRFGDFTLKSGRSSPVYLDLRNLTGDPRLFRRVAYRYLPLVGRPDRVAAVPLAGLPIGTAVSLASDIPLVYPRPVVKDHGTRSLVEGPFVEGDTAVMVDDVATSGSSILESARRLREAGLRVDAAVVLVDRGGGAAESLAAAGIDLRPVTTLADIVAELVSAERIDAAEASRVLALLEG